MKKSFSTSPISPFHEFVLFHLLFTINENMTCLWDMWGRYQYYKRGQQTHFIPCSNTQYIIIWGILYILHSKLFKDNKNEC